MYITSCNPNWYWFAIGFYGSHYHNKKHLTCAALKYLYPSKNNEKWQIFGDFNLFLNNYEKYGGNGIDYYHTSLFNSTLTMI